MPTLKEIDGQEQSFHSREEKALALFYAAFNNADIGQMETCWLQSENISMYNPIGGTKTGWPAIKAAYEKLFYGDAKVAVSFYDYHIQTAGSLFIATGRERGSCKTNEETLELAIRTTRIFAWDETDWKQIHHHGSIANPDLLQSYQQIIHSK
jgi:hypothetical protein